MPVTKACIAVAAAAAVLAGSLGAGAAGVWHERAALAQRLEWTEAQSEALAALHEQWVAATVRGDALTRQLARERAAAARITKERDDALAQATDGRVCLRERALRVLDGAPGLAVELPEPAGGADGADGGRVATDRDLARWAVAAGGRYAECARRLNALIDWSEGADKR